VLPVWLRGGTNVILGGFDPERFTATVAAEKITASIWCRPCCKTC